MLSCVCIFSATEGKHQSATSRRRRKTFPRELPKALRRVNNFETQYENILIQFCRCIAAFNNSIKEFYAKWTLLKVTFAKLNFGQTSKIFGKCQFVFFFFAVGIVNYFGMSTLWIGLYSKRQTIAGLMKYKLFSENTITNAMLI